MSVARSLQERGIVDSARAERLEALETRRLFSLHRELRALFYLGVLLVLAGVGATVKGHLERIGPLGLAALLAAGIAACFAYCVPRGAPFSLSRVDSPSAAFDYVLYLGCGLIGVELAFLESQFHLLGSAWRLYLLFSGLFCGALAYRYDNRLVLAAGLLNVAGFLELSFDRWGLRSGLRERLFLYSLALGGIGRATASSGVKAHFKETYLTLAVHCAAWALLPGVFDHGFAAAELLGVGALAGACVYYAYRRRRFAFLLYGCFYGYLAFATAMLRALDGSSAALFFLVSALGLGAFLFMARRSFARQGDE
jgi:hypothetical protein